MSFLLLIVIVHSFMEPILGTVLGDFTCASPGTHKCLRGRARGIIPAITQIRSVGNAGDLGLILGREDPLEKGKATHSSMLAWRIP